MEVDLQDKIVGESADDSESSMGVFFMRRTAFNLAGFIWLEIWYTLPRKAKQGFT